MVERNRLIDMLLAARQAIQFAEGQDERSFAEDTKTLFAVARALEVLGEAANRTPEHQRALLPQVPWNKIVGLRNLLAREYFKLDERILWNVVQDELPGLVAQLETVVKEDQDS